MAETRAGEARDVQEKDAPEMAYPMVELRQYTLKPGRRDELIALFEQHFIEGQEEAGMQLLGQFRCRTDPHLFVWLRSFPDMEARRQALQRFYYGPIWQAHRTAANDTMLDSDNVLLLKPARPASGLRYAPAERPAIQTPDRVGGLVSATVLSFKEPVDPAFVAFFEAEIAPAERSAGAVLAGYYITEPAENTFPQLPVRAGEHIFVWFATFADEEAYIAYQQTRQANPVWATTLVPVLRQWLVKPEEVLELIPTRRSLLRHHSA